ncbi:MAG: hypothetical protein ACKO6A_01115 [Bacteroidota bacterium]
MYFLFSSLGIFFGQRIKIVPKELELYPENLEADGYTDASGNAYEVHCHGH